MKKVFKASLLFELYDHLYSKIFIDGSTCNDSFSITKEFLLSKGESIDDYMELFTANGAYCDCEIGYNMGGNDKLMTPVGCRIELDLISPRASSEG